MNWRVDGLLVAMDRKGGIGKDGKLPWPWIPEDMQNFHRITCSVTVEDRLQCRRNVVVMGRKTFDSLPSTSRPLRGRINIVVTTQQKYEGDNCWDGSSLEDIYFVPSYEEALFLCDKLREKRWAAKVFGIGGASCYTALLPFAEKVYLTEVEGEYSCDTFFHLDMNTTVDSTFMTTVTKDNKVLCTFRVLEKKATPT